jgi:folate-binding protein YgfZ
MTAGAGVLDTGRGVLAVTGPLRQKFLHGLLSNDVASLSPGQGRVASLMDARGHVLALLRVLVRKDEILLELPAAGVGPLRLLLEHYRVGAPVRFAEPETRVAAVLGDAAREALARAGAEVGDLAHEAHVDASLAGRAVLVSRASDLPDGAWVVHAASADAGAVREALEAAGSAPLSTAEFDARRVEDGIPLYGVDVTEANLLHETGLVPRYHSPAKGCYVGQETIARLEARGGNVNKRLRGLRLGAPAAAGDWVEAAGKEAGVVTTAAVSSRLGPVALGYVHRDHAAPGTAVLVGGAPASVVELPFPR